MNRKVMIGEPSKSIKEHSERQYKCFDFDKLSDGERKMLVLPAYDLRNTPDNKYGQHSCELIFAECRGNHVVSITFYTGWSVDGNRVMMHDRDIGFMRTGLYNHYSNEAEAGEGAYSNNNCPFMGGKCWGELGSSLYGDTILIRLLNEGSAGVWDEIDKEFKARETTA